MPILSSTLTLARRLEERAEEGPDSTLLRVFPVVVAPCDATDVVVDRRNTNVRWGEIGIAGVGIDEELVLTVEARRIDILEEAVRMFSRWSASNMPHLTLRLPRQSVDVLVGPRENDMELGTKDEDGILCERA